MSEKGAEVVLIEFLGNAESSVKASEETVAGLDAVTAAADRAAKAQLAAGDASAKAGKKTAASAERAAAASKASAKGMSASFAAAGAGISKVGKGLTKWVSLPLLGIGAASTKMALDFQKSMLLVETHTDTSRKMVERYKKSILDMSSSGKYTQGPREFADAMYHIASDGYKGTKALEALKESANLAMLGQSDLAETTYAVVSAMKTGIKGTQNLHETIGTLNGTMGAGDTKMGELTAALSTGVVPAARSAGLELKDVGAAIAFLTARGIPAQKAAYGLSMNFQQLVPYTEKAQNAFKALGLGMDELGKKASSGPEGWLHALEDLKAHMKGLDKFQEGTFIREIFGGGRTSRGVLAQMQNLKDLGATYKRLGDIATKTDKNLETARKSPANVWKEEWSKLQAALVEVGDELVPVIIPAFKEVANTIVGLAKGFNGLNPSTKKFAIELGLIGIAAGPVLRIVGGLTSGVGKLIEMFAVFKGSTLFAGLAQALGGDSAMLKVMGSDLMGGLAKAIPGAAAAVGIGNIISSVISGDMKDAGFEAGGALVGGIAGFLAGGPIGAMLGVGLGSIGGELISGLFGSGDDTKHMTTLQEQLAQSAHQVAAAVKKEAATFHNLSTSAHGVVEAHKRQKRASHEVEVAERKLSRTRQKFGPLSQPAIQAEVRLKRAKDEDAAATKRVQRAERFHGVQLEVARKTLKYVVASEKTRIDVLEESRSKILQQEKAMLMSGASGKELAQIEKRMSKNTTDLSKAKGQLGRTLNEASQKVNPHYAKTLQQMTITQLEFGKAAGVTLKEILHPTNLLTEATKRFGQQGTQATGHVKGAYEKLKGVQGPFFSESKRGLGQVGTAYTEMDTTGSEALGNLGNQTNSFLKAVHHGPLNFGVTTAGGKEPQKKARGGFLAGSGRRDTEHVMAAPGEAFLTHQQQGPVSTALAVSKAIGAQPYGSLNELFSGEATPHYMARGGLVEPHVSGGARALVGGDQGAIDISYQAAKKYIAKFGSRSVQSVIRNGNRMDSMHQPYLWGGGHGSTASKNGPWDCSGGISELLNGAGWHFPPMVSGGFENWGLPGKGDISILANAEHVYAVVKGKGAIGTSDSNPGGGFGWISEYTFRPGFTVRHADTTGIAPAATASGKKGKGQKQKKGFARGGFVGGAGKMLAKAGRKAQSFAKGGWVKVGATIDPEYGNPAYSAHGGMSFAELLQAGANRSLKSQSLTATLGIGGKHYEAEGQDYGMAMETPIKVKMPGAKKIFTMYKNDVGSGQAGDSHYKVDLHSHIASALGWSGNADIEVATVSGAGSASKPPPPKQVKGKIPPHGTAAGGVTAPAHYKVQTDQLSLGSVPSTIHECRQELSLRRRQLTEYRAAEKAEKRKDVKHKLNANVKLLEHRIQQLVKQIQVLAEKKRKERRIKKIESRGTFPGIEEQLKQLERKYNKSSEFAEQVLGLEPEEKPGQVNFLDTLTAYVEGQEAPAWKSVLGTENVWRTTLLKGEETATKRIESLEDQIKKIEKLKSKPKAWAKQKYRIPPLKKAIAAAKEAYDPGTKMGSFEEQLEGLQGPGGSHEILAGLPEAPEAGKFGGSIWDTQMSIRELGLKLASAIENAASGSDTAEGTEGNAELLAATQEQLEIEQRGRRLSQAQYGPFQQFLDHMALPYIGAFKTGGVIPGNPNTAYAATVHGGETIVPAGAAGPVLELHLHGDMHSAIDSAMPGLVKEIDRQMGERYRVVRYGPGGGRGRRQ
jgi:TP901 family phage tail tape measure protein